MCDCLVFIFINIVSFIFTSTTLRHGSQLSPKQVESIIIKCRKYKNLLHFQPTTFYTFLCIKSTIKLL